MAEPGFEFNLWDSRACAPTIRHCTASIWSMKTITDMSTCRLKIPTGIDGFNWQRSGTILVWVCWGHHHKIPQTRELTQQKLISSQCWRLEIQDQGLSKFGFSWGLSHWLQMAAFWLCLLMAISPSLCSGHTPHGVPSSPYKDTSQIGLGSHPYDLIEPSLPPLWP